MNYKAIRVLVHILGVMVFLSLPVLMAPRNISFSDMFVAPMGRAGMMTNFLLVLYFYINYFLLIPAYYFKKKYWIFSVFTLLLLLVVILVPMTLLVLSPQEMPPGMPGHHHGPPNGQRGIPLRGDDLMLFLLVFVGSLMVRINARWKAAEQERVSAELAHLKAQINPHFLFNTLNSIYALAIQKSDETPEAVVRLSGMMRYVIQEADKDLVPLDKEIAYLRDYIDLQKIRLSRTTRLDFSVDGDTTGKMIAPLLLIPFVENAFKYGVNPEKEAGIRIGIVVSDGRLDMIVRNDKVVQAADGEKSGIGIQNTRNRLEHIYGHGFLLDIKETDKEFMVTLNLVLA